MPTIITIKGYRLYFVSFDGTEPVHVHIRKENRSAKVWLDPLSLAWSDFEAHENHALLKIVKDHGNFIREKWNAHFGI